VNGIHDMGGMDGFGAVVHEENEPAFHFDWEKRAFGIALAAGAGANTDEFRHAIERIPASRYLNSSYYERWLDGIQILLLEKGLVSREELALRGGEPVTASQPPHRFEGTPPKTSRERVRFHKGDRVVARNLNPAGHTRLARYVRAKRGVIWRDWGVHVFPDSNAHGGGKRPQHVYCVAFKARELWGADASSRDCVFIDLWEDYLEPGTSPPKGPANKKPAAAARRRKKQ
jgi:nitrile hydratase beta subunit